MTPQQANELDSDTLRELAKEAGFDWHKFWQDDESNLLETFANLVLARRAPAPTSEPGARDAVPEPSRESRIECALRALIDADDAQALDDDLFNAGRSALATPASPAVLPEDELEALMYPPKAMLKREDWNPVTRKPYPADPAPLAAQASPPRELSMARIAQLIAAHTDKDFGLVVEPFARAIYAEASPLVEDAQRIVAGKVDSAVGMVAWAAYCPKGYQFIHEDKRVVEDYVYTRRYTGEGPFSIMHMEVTPVRATTGNATADDGKDK